MLWLVRDRAGNYVTLDKPTLIRIANRTLRNLGYLLLAFPLGLFYFIVLFTMIVTGLALVIIWIGIPILLATIWLWWVLARFDRRITNRMLHADIPPMTRQLPVGHTITRRFLNHLRNPLTWTSLIYLFLKFPLGLAAITLPTVAIVFSFRLLIDGLSTSLFKGIFLIGLGVILLFIAILLINGLAAVWQVVARWMLMSPDARARDSEDSPVDSLPPESQEEPVKVTINAIEPATAPEPVNSTIVDPVSTPSTSPVEEKIVAESLATTTPPDSVEKLTPREAEVMALLADGLSNREIADEFFVTEGTIKRHTHNIYRKLNVNNRTQAVLRAHELGILE